HRLSRRATGISGKIQSLGVARRRAARLCCLRATIFARAWAAGTLNQFECLRTSASMPDLADLYPGFASHWIDTAAGRVFARSGGMGPPLLLLHGYPQTNAMLPRGAPPPAAHFSPILPHLPPYA